MRIRYFFLVLLIAILSITGCSKPEPDQAINKYLEAYQKMDFTEKYNMVTQQTREMITEVQFVNKYEDVYEKLGITDLNITVLKSDEIQWNVVDNKVEIPLKIDFSTWKVGKITVNQNVKMVYIDKQWLIDWEVDDIIPQLQSLNDRIDVIRTLPVRGNILDRKGNPLSQESTVYAVGIFPGKAENLDSSINQLAKLINLNPASIKKLLQQTGVKPHHFVKIYYISETEFEQKKADLMSIPGVDYATDFRYARTYIELTGLSSTLGYLGEINKGELEEKYTEGYQIRDLVGRIGLEKVMENKLRGKPGYLLRVLNSQEEERSVIKFTRPVPGEDITLTIDRRLQTIIERILQDFKGCAVALKPDNGEVLALASFPGFKATDFNLAAYSRKRLSGLISSTDINQLLLDKTQRLFNKPVTGLYIPGSTFKVITALTALEYDDTYDPEKKVNIPDDIWKAEAGWGNYVVKRVPRPEGPVDLTAAMKWSDNIYFARLAYNLGSDKLYKMADRLGFGETIPFIFNTGSSSLARIRPIINSITLADTGYGQGEVLMNPLHLSLIYSALATDGKMKSPVLLKDASEINIWKEKIADEKNIKLLQKILKVNIEDETAYAHPAYIEGLNMAGKTGTA
ncbi:MAG: penicillin-binding transpeptidase domain-containing protein, partial [Bacillota bacterium]